MSSNPFVRPIEEYRRDINVLGHYFEQVATYLSRRVNITVDEAREYIKKNLAANGRFPFKDPNVQFLERNQYGDRKLVTGPLSKYIADSVRDQEPVAPTFTTYLPVAKEKAILAEYIEVNASIRKKMKAQMIEAEARGFLEEAELKNVAQKYAKQKNNSLSGTAASTSTAFINQTAHSTLTSVTRSASSYANANNERILTGTRHYWSPRIVNNALTATIGRCPHERVQKVIEQYQLTIPSVDDVMACIEWSTRFYWSSPKAWDDIRAFVETMADTERVMFVYTGDLHHLRLHNPELIRRLLTGLSEPVYAEVDDPVSIYKKASKPIKILANQLCPEHTFGKTLADIPDHPDVVSKVASTILSINATIAEFHDLLSLFMTSSLLPGSIARFTSAVRRAVIMSDTDSTIFTTERWTEWMTGEFRVSPQGRRVGAAMVFLVESSTQHILSTMAINMGVSQDLIDTVEMKNEYTFEVFAATTSKKHYYCLRTVLEGEQLKVPKKEIKGVGLVASTVPKIVLNQVHDFMEDVLMTLHRGEKLSLRKLIDKGTEIERQLYHDITHGSSDYFKLVKVKGKDAYKKGEESPAYQQHLFWNDVFGKKYGMAPPLPYASVKVSLDLNNQTQLNDWVGKFQDVDMRSNMKKWLDERGKKSLTTVHIPMTAIGPDGIPEEIQQVIDIDKIIYTMTSPMYMAYQPLGVHMSETRMFRHVYAS